MSLTTFKNSNQQQQPCFTTSAQTFLARHHIQQPSFNFQICHHPFFSTPTDYHHQRGRRRSPSRFQYPRINVTRPRENASTVLWTMCNTVRDTTPDLGSASGSSSASASAPVPRGARARRLCLPTTRELRYLSNINVRRSTGRAMFYTRTTAFSLLVWPLVIYDGDNKPKVKRETTTETASSASAGTEEDEGFVSADVGFEDCNIDDEEDDNNNDNDADDSDSSDNDYKSEDDTDSSGFETTDNDEQSINGRGSGKDSADMNSITTKSRFHGKTQSKMAQYPDTVPPWAYIVSIRTPKPILGKRATQRNRAKRRIRAVAGQILPLFAVRGIEYCFTLNPEILLIEHKVLVADMHSALKAVNCWSDYMTEDMVRREKYCER